jgi:hypothetical protein
MTHLNLRILREMFSTYIHVNIPKEVPVSFYPDKNLIVNNRSEDAPL